MLPATELRLHQSGPRDRPVAPDTTEEPAVGKEPSVFRNTRPRLGEESAGAGADPSSAVSNESPLNPRRANRHATHTRGPKRSCDRQGPGASAKSQRRRDPAGLSGLRRFADRTARQAGLPTMPADLRNLLRGRQRITRAPGAGEGTPTIRRIESAPPREPFPEPT
jgi:hypothetical protein